jgi:hypothetical protein
LQKISKSFRPGFRNVQKTVDFFPIPAEKGAKKIPGAGGRGSRPSITISKLASSARNTAGREQSDLLVGSEVEGSGQGHSPECAARTNCKLVKKNLIRLSAHLSGQLGGEAMRAPGSSYRDVLQRRTMRRAKP